MATKISTEQLSELVINRVTSEEVYQNMVENGQVNEDELYFVEGEIDSLPSQAGNSGKFLTTDGTEASWADIPELGTIPRPNLLDNWYFVGGGSQQGGGQFPINQRGATSSYNSSGGNAYFIDRWFHRSRQHTMLSVEPSGLKIKVMTAAGTNKNQFINQRIENSADLLGKTVTISMLVPDASFSTGGFGLYVYDADSVEYDTTNLGGTGNKTASGFYTATFTIPQTITKSGLTVGFNINQASSIDDYIVVAACKLELGDTQTLAHQENGVWVLNEIPNYEEQKLRCASLIKTATGTIATNATSAAVSYTGTLLGAYAVMGGDRIETDMAVTASTVTFSTADYPDSAVTCTVIYM